MSQTRSLARPFLYGLVIFSLLAGTAYWSREGIRVPGLLKESGGAAPGFIKSARPELSLPEKDREYLWELEHHGNVLKQHGFKRLSRAFAGRDREGLLELLDRNFDGQLLDDTREISGHGETYAAIRREAGDRRRLAVDGPAFVDWLLQLQEAFTSPPQFEFGISELSPVVREDFDGDWLCTCKVRMWGHNPPAQPVETVLILRLRTAQPIRENLSALGWLKACVVDQIAVATAAKPLFVESAEARGLHPDRLHDNWKNDHKVGHTGGVYACDFNRDGCVDLLVTDLNLPGVALYAGSPQGGFSDITADVGLISPEGIPTFGFSGLGDACVFADLDNDGWEDLIVLAGGLYRNLQGRHFENMTFRSNLFALIQDPSAPSQPPSAILPADYDRDGLIDLYIVRSGRLRDPNVGWIDEDPLPDTGNQLLHNLGKGRFEDVTQASGTAAKGRSVFTAAWLDADNNGWPDVYVINEFGKGVLLANQGNGRFREHALVDGPADFGSMGLVVGDVDNDGWIDIYSANMYSKAGNRVVGNLPPGAYDDDVLAKFRRLVGGSRLYHNRGGLKFDEIGKTCQVHDVGWAWGAALADFNNDGWLDLYATAGYMSRDRTKPDG